MRLLRKLPMLLKRSLARKTLCMEENNKAHQVFKVSLGGLLFYLAGFLPYNIFLTLLPQDLIRGKLRANCASTARRFYRNWKKANKRARKSAFLAALNDRPNSREV